MTHTNQNRYIVQLSGQWHLYTKTCPEGWAMIGTIRRGASIGALAKSAFGFYAQVNGDLIYALNYRKVLAAIARAE